MMRKNAMRTFLPAITVLFIAVSVGLPATIHIPADYPTIQAGIDAAANGDTVLVAPGTYVENIDFAGKAITVESSDGPDSTVIDGSMGVHPGRASVVSFYLGEGPDSIIRGFTLTNGKGNQPYGGDHGYGGGIDCDNGSSPTIENNRIVQNSPLAVWSTYGGGIACRRGSSPHIKGNEIIENVSTYGAGIFVEDASAFIEDNIIMYNSTLPYGDGGGGIYIYLTSSATIENNVISHNSVNGKGGGILCDYFCYVTIESNIVSDNTATHNDGRSAAGGILVETFSIARVINNSICRNVSGTSADPGYGGGGLLITGSTEAYVANNLIADNLTYAKGGGVYCSNYGDPDFINNTIVGNTAHIEGGGFFCRDNIEIDVANTIFWGNSAPVGDEIFVGNNHNNRWGVKFTISYSDVEGGLDAVHVLSGGQLYWNAGMIDVDPIFVDAAGGDYHLCYPSPCRDAGDDNAFFEWTDYEGDPRLAYGHVDIGMDEFYPHLYATGNAVPGGEIEGKLVGSPGASPVGLFLGADVLDPPKPTSYGDFYIQSPWMLIPLMPIPADGILCLPTSLPATPPAPYDIVAQGLIGLNADSLTNLHILKVR